MPEKKQKKTRSVVLPQCNDAEFQIKLRYYRVNYQNQVRWLSDANCLKIIEIA